MSTLPSSWTTAPLREVADVDMGQSPPSATYNDRAEGLPFFQGKADFGPLYPTIRKWCSEPLKVAVAGDILLSVRAPVGPTNLAAVDSCIGRGLAAVRVRRPFEQKYMLHFFRSIEKWLEGQGTGSTFAAIGGRFVRELEVVVAPLAEQKRISDKLDALLARVDACRERLARVPVIVKRFRQSVLAAATSGELTRDWRAERSGAVGTDTWSSTTLVELSIPTRVITYGVIKLGDDTPTGVPCLRTSNVRWLRLDTEPMKRIAPSLSAEFGRTVLQGGEVLVNVRGTLGGVALVEPSMRGWNVSREVAVVPVNQERVNSRFLMYWIGSDARQRWLSKVTKGVAYTGINIEDLRGLPVSVPQREEQDEIVRRVQLLLEAADELERRHDAVARATAPLAQALLAKAFRGGLVPQEPNDEPASTLLARLRSSPVFPGNTGKPTRGGARGPRKKANADAIMLTRQDVASTHLTTILEQRGALTAEALWLASQLAIDDFYDQLRDEQARGHLRENRGDSPTGPRVLEAVA